MIRDLNLTQLDRPTMHPVRWIEQMARRFFSSETRTLLRQNAVRSAIASLIEIERMRLGFMIAHRNDG